MSMLSCPMCARLVSRRLFDPENLVEDVQSVSRRSLGRARGWEVTGRHSVLDDKELMEKIAKRCRTILEIIGEEVTDKSSVAALVKRLRAKIMELQISLEENIDEVEAWRVESEELIARVNDAFNSEYEELEDAVDFLLEVALEE